jgi:hypothetical protein
VHKDIRIKNRRKKKDKRELMHMDNGIKGSQWNDHSEVDYSKKLTTKKKKP